MNTPAYYEPANLDEILELLPSATIKEIVSELRTARKIKKRDALNLIARIAEGIYFRGREQSLISDLTPTREEGEALESFRAAALTLWRDCPNALRFIEMQEPGAVKKLEPTIRALEKLPFPIIDKQKGRGRPRTRYTRLELVDEACGDWQEVTGQAPTCRASELLPGFHYAFLRIWNEITGEELTSDALENDIKAALKSL